MGPVKKPDHTETPVVVAIKTFESKNLVLGADSTVTQVNILNRVNLNTVYAPWAEMAGIIINLLLG